jgi:hypothetical protein
MRDLWKTFTQWFNNLRVKPDELFNPPPANIHAPIMKVAWGQLKKDDYEHYYRRQCPVCENGLLLVRRHYDTFEIEHFDRCISCGQQVEYTDFDEVFGPENKIIRDTFHDEAI